VNEETLAHWGAVLPKEKINVNLVCKLFLAQMYLTATRIQLLQFLWHSTVSDIVKIGKNNIKQKRVKRKMERRVEMSSAGCSAIHFHAHKAECFVCSVVNKIKVLFVFFSTRLES